MYVKLVKLVQMPELPEVETICRSLQKRLPGRYIQQIQVLRPESIAYPKPREFIRQLKGHGFKSLQRRGKYLLVKLDNEAALVVHLGMSGRLLFCHRTTPLGRHVRVKLVLDNNYELRFDDLRVFGRLWFVPENQTPYDLIPGLRSLGNEPLDDLSVQYLKEHLRNRKRAIKSVLLDQRVIAGLGNIYADECLFLSGIHPLSRASQLNENTLKRLIKEIRSVLKHAIKCGGTTLRNYTDSNGIAGTYQSKTWVYGQAGKPCRRCCSIIIRICIAGRSSCFCPQCQLIM